MKSITQKKEFIAQSIDETKKRIDLFGQSMMILRKKKKKKSLQEEPIKLSNYQRSFPYNKPIFIPYYRFNREKSSNPIPSHEITKRTKFLLYLTLYLLKPNHSIDPIVVISLEVRPLVPPPPWSTEPSNDCKAPGPSAEGRADSSARSPS